LKISLGILTPAANRPEKKKGKRKKADDVSETANQKGKGPENADDFHSWRLRGLYTLAFLHISSN
jgi:Co/Zn/Cd efflux system component